MDELTIKDARRALRDSGEVLYTKSYMQRCLAVALKALEHARCSLVPEYDAEVQWILGRPCFEIGGVAECLRQGGYAIKQRAEDEQAFVAHWSLLHYAKHADDWRKAATEECEQIHAMTRAREREFNEACKTSDA